MTNDDFNYLQGLDWAAIGVDLVRFATRVANDWEAASFLPETEGLDDIVERCITKLLMGKTSWERSEGSERAYLARMVRNAVLTALKKSANRRRLREEQAGALDEYFGYCNDTPDLVPAYVDAVLESVVGDPELEEMVTAILDGCEPEPRHLATRLGVEVKEINNRYKRLRRKSAEVVERVKKND